MVRKEKGENLQHYDMDKVAPDDKAVPNLAFYQKNTFKRLLTGRQTIYLPKRYLDSQFRGIGAFSTISYTFPATRTNDYYSLCWNSKYPPFPCNNRNRKLGKNT